MYRLYIGLFLLALGAFVYYRMSRSSKFKKLVDNVVSDESPEKTVDDLISEKKQVKSEAKAMVK